MRRMEGGFTLLEALVVMAVIAILAAVAFPQYTQHVRRANRAVAKGALVDLAAREENWFTDRKTYTASVGSDGLNVVSGNAVTSYYIDQQGRGATSSTVDMIYQVSLATTSAGGIITGFTITATPTNQQVKDTGCTSLTLTNLGVKGQTGTQGSDCWLR